MAVNPNPSQLDSEQIAKREFDSTNDALRVNIVAAVAGGSTVDVISGDGSGNKVNITAGKAFLVDGSATTQPISVSSLPLPSGAATSAAQTDKSQFTKITDGTDTALITASGEQNVLATAQPGIDIGDVTVNNASGGSAVNIQDGGNSITVDGTITANAGTGNFTVVQATGTNLHVQVDSSALPSGASTSAKQPALGTAGTPSSDVITVQGITSMTALKVDGSGVTQPISGTINVKATTPTAGTVTQAAISVGTSAVRLTVSGSAPSAARSVLVATPDLSSTANFYIGSSSVANSGASRGIQFVAGQNFTANNDAGDYYIISDTASQTVMILEQA